MAKKVDSDVDLPHGPEPVGKPPPPTPPRASKLTTQDGQVMSGLFEQWLDGPAVPAPIDKPSAGPKKKK